MPVDIEQRLQAAEDHLRADLRKARASFGHAGNRGSLVEKSFRSFLKEHLPRRFDIGEGEIIDLFGNNAGSMKKPGQIDVIIANDSHPSNFPSEGPGLFFIEGVAAAGEVKSVLDKTGLEKTLNKCMSFKNLRPNLGTALHRTGSLYDESRFVKRRAYFIFAIQSKINLTTIHKHIINHAIEREYGEFDLIDAVFCLDKGTLIKVNKDSKKLRIMSNRLGGPIEGWIGYPNRPTLLLLLTWLVSVMYAPLELDNFLIQYLQEYVNKAAGWVPTTEPSQS